MEVLVFVGIVALGGLGAFLRYHLARKRREELRTMATQLGLEYSPADPFNCLGFPFALLGRGDGRKLHNVVWGAWHGMEVREFDYSYYERSTDSNGRSTRTWYHFSCAVAEIDLACSPLRLERETLFTRLADHVGLPDIEFESEDFNAAFNVKCPDRKFANDLVDARMMRWLLQVDGAFSFEVCGRWVLCYSKRRRPAELIPLLGSLQGFVSHVPRVVHSLYAPGRE